ncbi:hypothetical protein Cgig2_025699 [Carnegiea gigantea]|uniref:Uncharacterized protein n=1 Tax=Carnegiea gigantea TaxID=171969 RepID=A0A9Q1JPN5_9CARY|nr:hypothetical protein Cgig2_025699 [Carnegiea gigantea]
MDVDSVVVGNDGVGKELVIYVLWGQELEEGGDRKVTYMGQSTKCIVLKEGMAMEEVPRLVIEIIRNDFSERKLWYNLKYDRQMVVTVEGDVDMRMVFKGNVSMGICMWLGMMGGRGEHRRALVTERGGCVGDHLQSKLRLRGNHRTIFVAFDDVGFVETTIKGGDKGSKGSGCDEANNYNDSVWPRSSLQVQSYYHKS